MKKKLPTKKPQKALPEAYIENAGIVDPQPITETLTENFMPYAMSVILSRALPEIDGFKPSHRKLLYTMYKMGLLSGVRTKSANIVGQTMRLNPHGDSAIYETMVRLSRGNEVLLHAYIDSKGNFGKAYSRDMSYAASRYTEAKLDKICDCVFADIDKKTVPFVPNYDNTMEEPVLLPVKFPSILVNNNLGIAVSMASNICSFNLREVCEACIAIIKNKNADVTDILKAPDFPGGGAVVYNRAETEKIYKTGRGSFRILAKYEIKDGIIEITEIPPTTTVEAIIEKIIELCKQNKVREIADIRDETDLSGLKIAIDLKRGTDGEKLMRRLYAQTPLADNFACNFNILIGQSPRVMGVSEILTEWSIWRAGCIRRRVEFDLQKKREKLHLLRGLKKILLDIDKAVKIVRETDEEREVIPNLMIGFGIDQIQAQFVAEIRLRQLNREYILGRISEIETLEKDISDLEDLLTNEKRVDSVIIEELKEVSEKFGEERKTEIVYDVVEDAEDIKEEIPDYPVTLFVTREGYLKKITPNSLRGSGEHKLKEGDAIAFSLECGNDTDLLVFTDKSTVYKTNLSAFADGKVSVMGEFLAARLGFEPDESYFAAVPTKSYSGNLLFFFENGKVAKVAMAGYETKTNRKKLTGAYSDKSPLVAVELCEEEREFLLRSSSGRMLIFSSAQLNAKDTRSTQGVAVQTQNKNASLAEVRAYAEGALENAHRYRTKTLPAKGVSGEVEQISLLI